MLVRFCCCTFCRYRLDEFCTRDAIAIDEQGRCMTRSYLSLYKNPAEEGDTFDPDCID